jgi:amidase
VEIPEATTGAIRRAGRILAEGGWEVVETEAPGLEGVTETWGRLLCVDLSVMLKSARSILSEPLVRYMERMCRFFDSRNMANMEIHAERSRLTRLWSRFFADYPVMIAPVSTMLPWPVDADLDPESGLRLLLDATRFITPGSLMGIPSVALPMGLADRLPMGIQIYADLWREDLCLSAARTIESALERTAPIDPVW